MSEVINPEARESARAAAQEAVRDLRERKSSLDDDSIRVILSGARSHYAWQDRPVPDSLLEQIYEITALGATSMNSCPARFYFVKSDEARAKLVKC